MATPKTIHTWLTEYKAEKEKMLESSIKSTNAMSTISGVVATLSALVVAGNLAIGNNLEALQTGGTMAAMAACALSNSSISNSYKDELATLRETNPNSLLTIKQRLETLRYQLERNETMLGMGYLVSGGFMTSALAHIAELLTLPDPANIAANISGAALASLVSIMYIKSIKSYKATIQSNKERISSLEEEQELEELSKKPIPELIEQEESLAIESSTGEQPKILQLTNPEQPKK